MCSLSTLLFICVVGNGPVVVACTTTELHVLGAPTSTMVWQRWGGSFVIVTRAVRPHRSKNVHWARLRVSILGKHHLCLSWKLWQLAQRQRMHLMMLHDRNGVDRLNCDDILSRVWAMSFIDIIRLMLYFDFLDCNIYGLCCRLLANFFDKNFRSFLWLNQFNYFWVVQISRLLFCSNWTFARDIDFHSAGLGRCCLRDWSRLDIQEWLSLSLRQDNLVFVNWLLNAPFSDRIWRFASLARRLK